MSVPDTHAARRTVLRGQHGLGLLGTLVVCALVATAAALAFAWYQYHRPLAMKGERIEVRIPAGASTRTIARLLQDAGLVVDAPSFLAAVKATDAAHNLRAGRYEFARGVSLQDIVAKLRAGDVLRERLTIVEGWTFREMRAELARNPDLRQDSARLDTPALLKAIGATESHPEGLFAPDTYVFDPGSSDLDVLRQAYRSQAARLQKAWTGRSADLPLKSPYEALILASIVEKETGQGGERARIAGVFVNRLKKGMLLQTDPTIIYGLGEKFDGNLRKRDMTTDGPYNTYTRAGLPPTPIALPGAAALEATLRPAAGDDLYFVARGDGTSHFSTTLDAHNRAVAKYQLKGTLTWRADASSPSKASTAPARARTSQPCRRCCRSAASTRC